MVSAETLVLTACEMPAVAAPTAYLLTKAPSTHIHILRDASCTVATET